MYKLLWHLVWCFVDAAFLPLYMSRLPRRKRPKWACLGPLLALAAAFVYLRLENIPSSCAVVLCLCACTAIWMFCDCGMSSALCMGAIFMLIIEMSRTTVYRSLIFMTDGAFMLWAIRFLCLGMKLLVILPVRKLLPRISKVRIRPMVVVLLCVGIIQCFFVCYYYTTEAFGQSRVSYWVVPVICIGELCSLVSMLWQFDIDAKREEMQAMEGALKRQYIQQCSKETADREISRIYHDLKGQLAGLQRLCANNADMQSLLGEMEQRIRNYETVNYTKNPVLDSILNEKMGKATAAGLRLDMFVDFSLGGFISNIDICAIMVNAIDNAIEAASRVKDPAKRYIKVKAAPYRGYQLIKISNYFAGQLRCEGGRYLSSKSDGEEHGIGLASIRYSVNRYKGDMDIRVEEDLFSLTIMIPVPEGREGPRAIPAVQP